MRLKDEIIKEIKNSDQVRRALMDTHNVKETSVLRWLRENNAMLFTTNSQNILCTFLHKEWDDMIIYEEHDFKPVI